MLLYAALVQRTRRPLRIFTIVAAVVFAVMLIPPFVYIPSQPGASNGQTAILILMHIVAATVIVGTVAAFARTRTR